MNLEDQIGATRLAGGEISKWTLRFRHAEVEREFDQRWLRQSLPLMRIWSICGILGFVAFGLAEWWIYPDNLQVSFLLRYALILPLQIASVMLTYTPYHKNFHGASLVFCTLISNLASLYLFAITPFPQSGIYYFLMVIITLFTHAFIGIRFVIGFLASWLVFLGFLGIVVLLQPLPAKAATVFTVVLFLITTISVFATYNQEIHLRRDFRLNKLLEARKRESEQLAHRAMAASEAKSSFLAMMSHELRTPLNAIIGFAELMERQLFGPMKPDRYLDYIGDIAKGGRQLLGVINGILDLSKAEAGKLVLAEQPVDVVRVLDFCRRMVDPQGGDARARIETEAAADLPLLHADLRLCRQIVLNLASNAVKFTPPDGAVRICAAVEAGGIVVTVADTGIGIAPEDVAKAMTPFGQVDSTLARKYEGTGLGLPLAKALVELHGGTLVLDSAPGVGTTATVRFPATRTLAAATGRDAAD